jgi:hypothetical protein
MAEPDAGAPDFVFAMGRVNRAIEFLSMAFDCLAWNDHKRTYYLGIFQRVLMEGLGETFTKSPIELEFWKSAWPHIPDLHPQFGISMMHVDFAIPSEQIVIECDGREHHTDPEDVQRDARRDAVCEDDGWTVVRLTGSEIKNNRRECLLKIREAIFQRQRPDR